ncbi:MAG: methyltransferase domain-containing protein, partial [Microgenomates group bacterium]
MTAQFFLLIVLGIVSLVLVVLLIRMIIYASVMVHGAVFVRSDQDFIDAVLQEVARSKPKKIIDLGSGDGTIVLALAERGHTVDGIEINPILAWKSQAEVRKRRLSAKIYRNSFWNVNLESYDMVIVYGTTYLMPKLEEKLLAELLPGAVVVSNFFEFPNWEVGESWG